MKANNNYIDAILALVPNAKFYPAEEGDWTNLRWVDTRQQPTQEAVLAKIQELDQQYIDAEYQRQRAKAYPSFADQFDKLYHGGYDAWKAEITAIKEQYPKPTGGNA